METIEIKVERRLQMGWTYDTEGIDDPNAFIVNYVQI